MARPPATGRPEAALPPRLWSCIVLALLTGLVLPPPCPDAAATPGPDKFQRSRARMAERQIRDRGITDPATLRAMAEVPRHLFVPPKLAARAYEDLPLPIGFGQTISQPFIVAFMTEQVRPRPGVRILEIGTGSGYQAAVLAAAGAEVFSLEIIPELAQSAASRLKNLGYTGIRLREGDGYHGWAQEAPFDAIVVTAAAEFVPPPLLEQLADGGRMVIPVGSPFFVQRLLLVEKEGGKTSTRVLLPVRFVPLRRPR
ncbi:MAG: protein-L-isoaspartate O-methyltransferase [Desulfuromonas sp.]|uniref:protein-L-isoaspartate(D-aspartate) O-methyltransferase n=1 Tax=Desulfuromonas sp. TaxID=892 RepID=UPI000CBA760B|nr:protein-L-isoaspartate(D-aspartate) O-methyltransferase [Desulfuromonas sp.]PLX82596.1 MAG: protein-L-isoaspartate O-methyltransferase [Desulfuromonas sp.]